jgi:uncharacterized membrane protein
LLLLHRLRHYHPLHPRMASAPKSRLTYIDWMRGLACVTMFQTHCYDSWLSPEARRSGFFWWSQLGGTLPAPLFLFLAGVSFALVTDRMRRRGADTATVARQTIRRGAEILALGLAFRVQEFALGWPWSPWTDLLRVDVLNTIGLSMMLMGLVCRWSADDKPEKSHRRNLLAAALVMLAITLLTPLLWTTWRPRFLPWPIESYVNGVHIFPAPQPWLFPVFPWAAFAFAGLAAGFVIFSDWARERESSLFFGAGLGGIALIFVARGFDHLPWSPYPVYDYWHTSPNFFLTRVGILLIILSLTYGWCRWGAGQWRWSPLAQLGKTSLLVYWVHIEFVYGRFSILQKRAQSVRSASLGLLVIFLAMLALSHLRTRWPENWRVRRRAVPA